MAARRQETEGLGDFKKKKTLCGEQPQEDDSPCNLIHNDIIVSNNTPWEMSGYGSWKNLQRVVELTRSLPKGQPDLISAASLIRVNKA